MTRPPEIQRFGDIVVVGGGCYGSYYVRQLERAATAGAIAAARVVVVDHDAHCQVAALANGARTEPWPVAVDVVQADWREFFDRYLSAVSATPGETRDAIVPSPLMPHLMAEWLIARARRRWPGRHIEVRPLETVPEVPWSRAGSDDTHYVSFATWMCPVNCIEPRICPHTRGERTWSLPSTLAEHARERRQSDASAASVVLHCTHRAYGVGMFDTADVIAGDRTIAAAGEHGGADVLIGTMSHCHGALTRVVISAAGEPDGSGDC